MISSLIDKLQEAFPVNRVVSLLTPVFAILAGWAATWVADHFPYLDSIGFTDTQVLGFFVAGATAALVAAYKWVDGWQKHEQLAADPTKEVDPLPQPRTRN